MKKNKNNLSKQTLKMKLYYQLCSDNFFLKQIYFQCQCRLKKLGGIKIFLNTHFRNS